MKLGAVFQLLRPQQWIKNAFVLAPVFFAGMVTDADKLAASLLAALAFSLVASGIYVLNDVADAAHDRLHPKKKRRPVASGEVSLPHAALLGLGLGSAGLYAAYLCGWPTLAILLVYLAINVNYCLWLKHKAIADVFSVASGFVLRVLAGGAAAGVVVSQWLVIMTFLISLFLVLGKRRDDLTTDVEAGATLRPSLRGYTIAYVDVCLGLLTALLIMSYILYTLTSEVLHRRHGQYIYLSSALVLAGMFRYLQITIVKHESFSPTRVLFRDRFLQAVVGLWVLFFAGILYW